MVQSAKRNALHDLGYKIFLDRYAQKDMTRETLTVGDTVIVVVDSQTGQREIGTVTALDLPKVTVKLNDGETVTRDLDHVDKPIETEPEQLMDRVAAGIAAIEKTPERQREWASRFRWLLDDWKFVPGGRILTAAGTDQELTFYNCYVLPNVHDSREGIIKTLGQMTEIMSRGGGVGINLSTLRPRHAYVKGVNGRSSGSVSWGALYSFVTGLIEQGGCFGPNERIATDKGLIPAAELADRMDAGETFHALTHQGKRPITARFRNGVKPLYTVKTSRGYDVTITEDHKVAVLMDGQITTMALKYLQEGDEILLLLGDGVQAPYVEMANTVVAAVLNQELDDVLSQPLDKDFAYALGHWCRLNSLAENHTQVLDAIMRSSSRVMAAFISGYLRQDAPDSEQGYTFLHPQREFLRDIQQMLSANGIASRLVNADGVMQLSVIETPFVERMQGFMARDMRVVANAAYVSAYDDRDITQDAAQVLPDTITQIQPVGDDETYDFEVADVHLLSGNGIYTSNSRRGALMLILNDWHPDVFDFINSKRQAGNITNANISVGVSDKLMEAVKADGDWELVFPDTSDPDYDDLWDGDLDTWVASGRKVVHYRTVKARELWHAIIESAWASAEPGVWFRERSNKLANSWYFNPLIATNPCVTGDVRIHTDKGLIKARDLWNDETEIQVAIDGRFGLEQAVTPATRVFMTGVKPVFRLQTQEGYHIRATADHRIMTPAGWRELQDLKPGDKIHILNRKGGFGQEGSLRLGRILGWLVGDGSIQSDKAVLSFSGDEKKELAPLFAQYVTDIVEPLTTPARAYAVGGVDVQDTQVINEAVVQSARLRTLAQDYGLVDNQYQVPEIVFRGTEDMQRGFLQALFTAAGDADGRLASTARALLEDVQILLGNFGIASRIYQVSDGDDAQHELVMSRHDLSSIAEVASITADGLEEVFDLTESLTHSFVANNIVVHNCGEQPLGAWSVCNLGAVNLARFYDESAHDVDWPSLRQAVEYATRFLDNVIDTTPYFFNENKAMQLSERRVGLGTMGIAELMIKCGIRYGSDESVVFIDKVYREIACTAYETSSKIAAEKGAFPQFDAEKFLESGYMQHMPDNIREMVREHGIRNVTLLTQAPTGSTGTMVNTSTGIEPFFSWVYYRKSRLGLHEEQVPVVAEYYEQHPDADALPDYFVTAMDLSPDEHVKVQGAFQRWIDSAISKTCNVPNEYTVEQVSDLYKYMYELGCKGGTIYRDGSRDEQVLMLKGDERAESEMSALKSRKGDAAEPAKEADKTDKIDQVASPHRVWPRPTLLNGATMSFKTPFGTSYITMNSDENGNPFEVFITVGKAGSDVQADAEGLGRMISLQLRTTAPHNRREMLKLIIDQLQDIGGARAVGFGPNRVVSLPDAVAQALHAHYLRDPQPQQLGLPMNGGHHENPRQSHASPPATSTHQTHTGSNGDAHPVDMPLDDGISGDAQGYTSRADMCPDCGTVSLIRAEGCRKCLTCGYSEC